MFSYTFAGLLFINLKKFSLLKVALFEILAFKFLNSSYDKCFKISNTSCLLKRPRQTVQSQIRQLLKKQSDLGLPCLLILTNIL